MKVDDEVLFTITKRDLQYEAIHYLGRELTEEEYTTAKKLLEYGIGENLSYTYWGVFFEIIDKKL